MQDKGLMFVWIWTRYTFQGQNVLVTRKRSPGIITFQNASGDLAEVSEETFKQEAVQCPGVTY